MTLDEFLNEQLKNPAFKHEYDALEGWYQEELAKQEALEHAEEEEHRRASTPPITPRTAYA